MHILCCVFCFSSSCVPNVDSFSGLSICDCLLIWRSLAFISWLVWDLKFTHLSDLRKFVHENGNKSRNIKQSLQTPFLVGGQSFNPVCQSVAKFCSFFYSLNGKFINIACFFLLQFEALHIIASIFERIKVVSFSKAFHLQLLHLKGAVVAAIVW
jgi:hypothetical protein